MTEVGPRLWEMCAQLLEHCGIYNLTGFLIHETFAHLLQFFAAGIVGKALDHPVAACRHHGGIESVVAVTFFADLQETPAGA